MMGSSTTPRVGMAGLIALVLAGLGGVVTALGTGQSFTSLQAGYTQDVIGATQELGELFDDDGDGRPDNILGGVAFAADGDPLVADCAFAGTTLHRFDLGGAPTVVHGTALAPETRTSGGGGCGLVNHPDGTLYVAMNDAINGVANLDATTGALLGFLGPPANALGIAVDPVSGHLIYAAEDCRFTGTCTFINLDPATGAWTTFATLAGVDAEFIDGMYFDPTGTYLFLSNRWPVFRLTILDRTGAVVQHVPMTAEPDGVAFHLTEKFVVTNNVDGTMTRFDFPNADYTQAPAQTVFASGGYRGDLSQVGPDGCIYLTQKGTRYDDGVAVPTGEEGEPEFANPENSVVRICSTAGGGFAPPPGSPRQTGELGGPGTIGDFVWLDLNRDGVQEAGEPGLADVTVALTDSTSATTTTTTDANGMYAFTQLATGTYTVAVVTPAGHAQSPALAGGNAALDSEGTVATVVLATATPQNLDTDFGFTVIGTAQLAGFAYVDANGNAAKDAGEAGIGGVVMTLGGAAGASTTTAPDGSYSFTALDAGDYAVTAPAEASGKALATGSPLPVTLAVGESRTEVNFGYVPGRLAGFAYVDTNGNGSKDAGEAGIGGVTLTLSTGATTATQADGSYSFSPLDAGSYSVSAPGEAAGKGLATSSPLSVLLAAGQSYPDVNFGYVPGQLSGFAYVDANGNASKDAGEAGIGGVVMTLSTGATTATAADGSYSFPTLDAGNYAVSAPAIASGHDLWTASPLSVSLAAGELRTNVNFGYVNGSISGYAYVDANSNDTKDPGETGLGNVLISLTGIPSGAVLTNADGSYAFGGLLAGQFSVAAPSSVDTYTLTTPSPLTPAVNVGQNVTDVNFGYESAAAQIPAEFCSKASVKSVLDPATGRFPNNGGLDVFVHTVKGQSIQSAIDTAEDRNGDGYIIIGVSAKEQIGQLGGNVTENLLIDRVFPKPFALFACSVTVHDPVPGDGVPTGRITAAASVSVDPAQLGIYVMDVHADDSAVAGWKVEGNKRYLRNVEARENGIGVWFVGDNNTMHNGVAEANSGTGLLIQGNSNVVTDTDVMDNGGHGIQVVGDSNQILKADVGEVGLGNQLDGINVTGASTLLSENDAFHNGGDGIRVTGHGSQLLKNRVGDKNKGNGGDGIHLAGSGSQLQENLVYANAGDGIDVTGGTAGSPNVLKLNKSGDKTKGNGGHGILVAGAGNGTATPVEIDENTVKSNGLVGVQVTGSGHQLKKNTSGGSASGETNIGCEYLAATGNFNATGNKANGTTVAGSNNSPFPTSCVGP